MERWTIGYIDAICGNSLFLTYTHWEAHVHFHYKGNVQFKEKQIVGIKINYLDEGEVIDVCEYVNLDLSELYIMYDYQNALKYIASDNYLTDSFIRTLRSSGISKLLLENSVLNNILNGDLSFIGVYVKSISIKDLCSSIEVHFFEHSSNRDNTEDWTEVISTDFKDSYLNSLLQIKGTYSNICVNNTPERLPGETYAQVVERTLQNTKIDALKRYSRHAHLQALLQECCLILSMYEETRHSILHTAKEYLMYEND